MSFSKKIAGLAVLLTPYLALGAEVEATYVINALEQFSEILNSLIPIVIALTILAFFWFLFKYVKGGAEDKEGSKSGMIWSIVAIAIMFSIYGLVAVLQGVFGVDSDITLTAPAVPLTGI